jgi:hypothetical protein
MGQCLLYSCITRFTFTKYLSTNQYFPLCSSKLCLNLHMHHRINMKPRNMTNFLQKFAENKKNLHFLKLLLTINQLTSCSTVHSETWTGSQPVKKFPVIYGRFRTTFRSIYYRSLNLSHNKCPCNHSMLPQLTDGGTASRYVQQLPTHWTTPADSQQGVILQLDGWARC